MFKDIVWIANDVFPAALDAKESLFQALHSLYHSLDRDYSYFADLIDEGCASDLDKREYDSVEYQLTILHAFFRVLGHPLDDPELKEGAADD